MTALGTSQPEEGPSVLTGSEIAVEFSYGGSDDNFTVREPVHIKDSPEYHRLVAETADMLGRLSVEDVREAHQLVTGMYRRRKHGGGRG